jgi:ribosome-interacting GTPase 1
LSQIEDIKSQLEKMRIVIGDADTKLEEDVVFWNKKALIIGNKLELDRDGKNYQVLLDGYKGRLPVVAISAKEGNGLAELKLKIYQTLDIIRVYTKTPGQKADLTDPIVLPRGSTLTDAAASVHKDFAAKLKYARIWGSGKHDGIMVRRDHILEDGDVIELHL